MSMISTRTRRVKATRHTARPSAPFGAGLTNYVPFAVVAEGFVEPTDEDKAAAARIFADEPEPDWDMLAGEAEYIASVENLGPPPAAGVCKKCGEPSEELSWGLCPDCYDDAATDAAIACVNNLHGLGRRVF
jgi:hypothetical protein